MMIDMLLSSMGYKPDEIKPQIAACMTAVMSFDARLKSIEGKLNVLLPQHTQTHEKPDAFPTDPQQSGY